MVPGALLLAGIILVLPLGVVFAEAFGDGAAPAWAAVTEADTLAALRLTLLVTAIVVPLNTAGGLAAAWCIARFRFAGRDLLLAVIGAPLAVSPVIAGLVWVLLFGGRGWFGPALEPTGLRIIFATPGIVLATLFVTLPLVARQVLPLLQMQGSEEEECALTLGATGWQMFLRVTLPNIRGALLQGVLLCNARSMGEFGAVAVVSGHIRGQTNTMPLHVEALFNDFHAQAAFAVAALLALLALATLAVRALLDWLTRRAG